MTERYALRMELTDGTLVNAYQHVARKVDAVSAARRDAKTFIGQDIVRIWVDDTKTELGIVSFETAMWKKRREELLKELCQ